MRAWYLRRQSFILGATGVIGLLLIWELLGRTGLVDPFFISTPSLVWVALIRDLVGGSYMVNFQLTLVALLISFSLAAVIGIISGFAMAWNRYLDLVLSPYVWFLYSAPLVAFYPLLILWLGFGMPTTITIAYLLAVFPILVSTMAAVQTIDPVLIHAARSFGAPSRTILWRVVLPGALPMLVAGLRLGVGRALIGVVVGELFSSNAGLGFYATYWGRVFKTADMFAAIVGIAVIALVTTQGLRLIEERLSVWRPK